ncbi:MAG: ABC transporter permease subunit, partial [Rhizobiales bacterium]|nr:ABC transporter permease subunit [Hyphomicrobiales bacterium]
LGLVAGLAVAFVLAALSVLAPALARAMLPFAMVAQNMPLVALVPFVVLVFGRGTMASVFMAVIVVFFPAYVMLNQGFAMVPRAAGDLVSVYGGSRLKRLVFVTVPFSTGHLFAAARLVAPQALLGVLLAEWLLSGVGLGNLLNISRGRLDYDMIWAGALVSILISVAAYEAVGLLERTVRR